MAPIRARDVLHFAITGDPELIYKSVLAVIFVPYSPIKSKFVVLQHHSNEDVDSYASVADHQKIVSIVISSFSPQLLISPPVSA